LIVEALAIEAEDAIKSGNLGFMTRALVQATMPHSKQPGSEFTRRNGLFRLTILSPAETGLPYGSIPRLLIAWITTEVIRTRERQILLGDSLSSFMKQLELEPTGGKWGTITRLRDQIKRLFSSSIKCFYDSPDTWAVKAIEIIEDANLWWYPKQPDQITLFESTLTLSERFFKEIIDNPVPVDMRALKALSKSPLSLDIYCWLTYRMSYLKHQTCIPWGALEIQFGSDYKHTRQFKAAFLKQLRSVLVVYPKCKVLPHDNGLILKPSHTHIRMVDKSVNSESYPRINDDTKALNFTH
jgi:Plasmid encoded RepA protein